MKPDYSRKKIYSLHSEKGENYFICSSVMEPEKLRKFLKRAYNKYMTCFNGVRGREYFFFKRHFKVVEYDDFEITLLESNTCDTRKQLNKRIEKWNERYDEIYHFQQLERGYMKMMETGPIIKQ